MVVSIFDFCDFGFVSNFVFRFSELAVSLSNLQMLLKEGILYSELLAAQPVIHGFTTRALGNLGYGKNPSDPVVGGNRERLLQQLNLTDRMHIQPKQVHSDRAVSALSFYPGYEADAVYSLDPQHLLSVLTADCVPIILYFPVGFVAAIHAGWRGLFHDIIPKTLNRLPTGAIAAVGPAIGPCCYEVGEELASDFEEKFGKEVIDRSCDKPHLDLIQAAVQQLKAGGVNENEIDAARLCTYCHPDLFFSYRRDGSSGRQMSFVTLR